MKHIAFLFSQPRKKWQLAVRQNRMPDHVLYGLNWLEKSDYQVFYSDLGFSHWNLLRWPVSPLQRYCLKHLGVGFQLDQALALLPQLNRVDLIITTNDSCGLPIALLKKLKLLKPAQIYLHLDLATVKSAKLHHLTQQLLQQPQAVICLSQEKVDGLRRKFNLLQTKVHFIPPGVDVAFFKPEKLPSKYDIVAIGRDVGRDYGTLFKAVASLPIKVKLICDPKNIAGLTIPQNVQVKFGSSYSQVRRCYHQAKIVVVPTRKDSVSGQISFLEALACGKPIIAADTFALNSSFISAVKNFCLYYRPQDPRHLRATLLRLINDKKLIRRLSQTSLRAARQFSSRIFATKLTSVINPV